MRRSVVVGAISVAVLVVPAGVAPGVPTASAYASGYTVTNWPPPIPPPPAFAGLGGRVAWSKDGATIYFDRENTESGATNTDIYKKAPDGAEGSEVCLTCGRTALPNTNIGMPEINPSGQWLLFQVELASHADPQDTGVGAGWYHNLFVMDLQNPVNCQTFSPTTCNLYQLTNVRDHVPVSEPPGGTLHPHFSHAGTKVLWSDLEGDGVLQSADFGNWRLQIADFTADAGTGSGCVYYSGDNKPCLKSPVTHQPGDRQTWYESHGWGPDDSWIYFSCAPVTGMDDQNGDICTYNLITSALTRLTLSSGMNGEPAHWDEHAHLSPAGDVFSFMSSQQFPSPSSDVATLKTDLWLMNVDGSGQVMKADHNVAYDCEPDYDPCDAIVGDNAWNPNATGKQQLVTLQIWYDTATPRNPIGVTDSILEFDVNTNTGSTNPWAQTELDAGNGWEVNPEYAFVNDTASAWNFNGEGHRHRYYNYGFTLPPTAIVDGIQVRADWRVDAVTSDQPRLAVDLSWDGGTSWTMGMNTGLKYTPCGLQCESASEVSAFLGGSSDKWGRTAWSATDLTNGKFVLRVMADCYLASCSTRDWAIDWLAVTVWWRTP